jgi:crotonobetaine/carnitine-CoA ligase
MPDDMNLFEFLPRRVSDDRLDVVPLLASALTSSQPRVMLSYEGDDWTNMRIAARVVALQAWLSQRGIGRGDRVAVMLKNSPDHIALIYALILLGIVWVPVNTRLKTAGLEYLADHCCPQ